MKTKKTIFNLKCLTLSIMLFVSSLFIVSADHYVDFTVTPILPENQHDKNADYFDLLLKPEEKQTIVIEVSNRGSKNMIATIELADGVTGDNGAKLYEMNKPLDESQQHALSEISKLKIDTLIIPAQSTGSVSLEITMPKESFDGVILGGIRVYADTEDNTVKDSSKTGLSLKNRLDYVVAVQIRNNTKVVERNLNLKSVGAKLSDYLPRVFANIQNDKAVLMNGVDITGVIENSNKKQVGSVNVSGQSIMPNTNFNVVYEMMKDKLSPGEYTLDLKITHDDRVWEWNEDFVIGKDEADNLNEQAIFTKEPTNWLLIWVLSILVLIILILLFILFKRRKDEKETSEKN